MKIFQNIYFAFLILFFSILLFGYSIFHYELSSVSNDKTIKEVVIKPGSISSIAETLKKENVIRNKFAFIMYVRITKKTSLKAATYSLSESMSSKEIINLMYKGKGTNNSQIKITFKEGKNMRIIAKTIAEKTNHTEEEVYEKLKDTAYLKNVIEKYWFINEDILQTEIYYSLEGYLYPSTYYYASKDVEIEEILNSMLDEMEKQLANYQTQIQNQSMTFHELLTLASIVELEGVTLDDRKGIAGVFLNRLNHNMNLGSDVTTYYGAKIDMGERDLSKAEINECNNYNTRCATYTKLPVSPISNPSIDSIIAVLEPTNSDNYYFVADKNKKVYFSKNITEHNNTIAKLKKEGLWYEY